MNIRKMAMVTGASEGIGRAICLELARRGWTVTAVARNKRRLEELCAEMTPGDHGIIGANLATEGGLCALEGALRRTNYHLLVNCAGAASYGPFSEQQQTTHHDLIELNVRACTRLSHAFLRRAKRGAALINVASGTAFTPLPYCAAYCATKAYQVALSQALWFEWRRRDVYVAALVPGPTESEFHRRAGGDQVEGAPDFIWESPVKVAEAMMRGLEKRKHPVIYSNPWNKILILLSRVLSRRTITWIMGRLWEKNWSEWANGGMG